MRGSALFHFKTVIFSVASIILATGTSPARAADLTLVRDGKPAATIIIASSATKNAIAASAELQKYITKISGATLPIVTDYQPTSGTLVLVGPSKLTTAMADLKIPAGRTKNLAEEGFVICTAPDRLVLAGNDESPYLGTRYAVVELLNRLGVRWFMPGEIGEVVPKLATISIPDTNVTQRPDFAMRNWWEHARKKMGAECDEWKIHNFMNPWSQEAFGVPSDGSIKRYLPKEGPDKHPEWFALQRDGKRAKDHPCTTSEEMIHYVADRIKSEARKGAHLASFAPIDGNPRCWCKNCEKIGNSFDGFGSNNRDPVPEYCATNEWFYFVNRVLAEVNKEFPDFTIASNGYANRVIPPEIPPDIAFNPEKNLVVMFANIEACTIHAYDDPNCWQINRQAQMLQEWCRLSDKVYIYNYNYTMMVNKGTITPMVHRIRRNIPLLKQWGLIGFFDQDEADWALTGIPTRLVRARLEWNVKADVDAVLEDFYTKWFGAAAAPMKKYYDALEDAFDKSFQHGHEDVILRAIYTDALMTKLDACITGAEAAAQTNAEKSHLRLERAMYDHLRTYVAMETAKAAAQFADAAKEAARLAESQDNMNKLTAFMGWHPYKAYECDWERKRQTKLAARVDGTEGDLIALLPEKAAFRLDPSDDGRFERWQSPDVDLSIWKSLLTTAGWDTQGILTPEHRSYQGLAWYAFDVDVPAVPKDKPISLYAPALVNEAWLWVNGRYAGHRPYMMPWFRPQAAEFDITKLVKPEARNRIALRVLCNMDAWGANGIYERLFLYAKNPATTQKSASK